jgi:hypothetical protein
MRSVCLGERSPAREPLRLDRVALRADVPNGTPGAFPSLTSPLPQSGLLALPADPREIGVDAGNEGTELRG